MRKTLRVLVVDPCPDTVASLSWLLHCWGYVVLAARNGPDAVKLAQAFEPDAVLSEVVVPGMSGFDLVSQLRGSARRPLLVAVTGRGTEADRQRTLAAGFHSCLIKPADPVVLQELLACWAQYRLCGPDRIADPPTCRLRLDPSLC